MDASRRRWRGLDRVSVAEAMVCILWMNRPKSLPVKWQRVPPRPEGALVPGDGCGILLGYSVRKVAKISLMPPTDDLSIQELHSLATEWRRRALEGERHARGIAHQLESALRRRRGALFTSYDTLDMRSLENRQRTVPWWLFWRKRPKAGEAT